MLPQKKVPTNTEKSTKVAKKADVAKAISKSNKKHVYMIHEATIPEFGGNPGFYDYTDRRIESILSLQYPVFGYNKYPDLFPKNEYE